MCVCVCVCVCVCAYPTQDFFAGFRGDLATQVLRKHKKDLASSRREAHTSAALVSIDGEEETEGGGDDDPEEEEEDAPEPEDGLPRVADIAQVLFLFCFLFRLSLNPRCQATGTSNLYCASNFLTRYFIFLLLHNMHLLHLVLGEQTRLQVANGNSISPQLRSDRRNTGQ